MAEYGRYSTIAALVSVLTVSTLLSISPDFFLKQHDGSRLSITTKQEHTPSPLDNQQQILTEPWDIVDQYIAWHSEEALHLDPSNRSYAIAFYSCPHQVGNRWHHFLNSFLWSIVTNRTLLWQYWDQETCQQFGGPYDGRICSGANQVEECDVYLERDSWMPSYQNWTAKYKNHPQPKQLSYWTTHGRTAQPGRGVLPYDQSTKSITEQLGIDARHDQWPVVVFPQMLGPAHTLGNSNNRQHLLQTKWAQQTAKILYKYGTNFLFGLLFDFAFGLTHQLYDNTTAMVLPNKHYYHENKQTANSKSNCSIAVHSRHTNRSELGNDVSEEIQCIQSLWNSQKHDYYQSCDLYIASDRPHTLEALVNWCMEQNPHTAFPCRTVVFALHQQGTSFATEHG